MPNFGYETPGDNWTSINNTIRGSYFTCPEAGTANSITVFLRTGGYNEKVKCSLHKQSDYSFVDVTQERTDINHATGDWFTFTFGSPPILSNIAYYICAWNQAQVFGADISYVTTGVPYLGIYDIETYDSFPDPLIPTVVDTKCGIYCTYTPTVVPPKGNIIVQAMQANNFIASKHNFPSFKDRFPKFEPRVVA